VSCTATSCSLDGFPRGPLWTTIGSPPVHRARSNHRPRRFAPKRLSLLCDNLLRKEFQVASFPETDDRVTGRRKNSLRSLVLSRLRRREGPFPFRTVLLVLAINGGSKVGGFVREVYISSLYGVSKVTDSFFAVQQIPILVQSYMFGAFNLVFIPKYASAKQENFSRAFLRTLLKILVSVGMVLTGLMFVGAHGWVPRIVGLGEQAGDLAGEFARILSLAVVPVILLGLGFGMFHAERQHAKAMLIAALSPFAMLLSLVGLSLVLEANLAYALPWSFVVGAFVAAGCATYMMLRLVRSDPAPRPQERRAKGPFLRGFFKQLSASSAENVGFNLNQLLNVFFAGSTGPGSVAVYAYATRLAMLPLSGIVAPLAQMIQAWLSSYETPERRGKDFALIALAMLLMVLLIALLLIAFRVPLVRFVYQRGEFSASDTLRVSWLLVPYASYFAVMSLNQLFGRYFFVLSRGGLYTTSLLAGYFVSNLLKPFLAMSMGVSGIIWACAIGEGLALLSLVARFVWEEALPSW
jgi:putative peptidoglycan lipid II flippase